MILSTFAVWCDAICFSRPGKTWRWADRPKARFDWLRQLRVDVEERGGRNAYLLIAYCLSFAYRRCYSTSSSSSSPPPPPPLLSVFLAWSHVFSTLFWPPSSSRQEKESRKGGEVDLVVNVEFGMIWQLLYRTNITFCSGQMTRMDLCQLVWNVLLRPKAELVHPARTKWNLTCHEIITML